MAAERVEVAVLGAGIAGSALAHRLKRQGREVALVGPTAGNGLPLALCHEYAGRSFGISSARRTAFSAARELYATLGVAEERSMLRPLAGKAGERLINSSEHLRTSETPHEFLEAEDVEARFTPLCAGPAVRYEPALLIEVPALLSTLTRGIERIEAEVDGLRREGDWLVEGCELRARHVVLALGCSADEWFPEIDVSRMPGVVAEFECAERLDFAVSAKGYYAVPTGAGCIMGAARDLGDPIAELRAAADKIFRPQFLGAERWRWVGERLVENKHRSPFVGQVRPGLSVLVAMGSKGFLWSPWSAELIAQGASIPAEISSARASWSSPRIRDSQVS